MRNKFILSGYARRYNHSWIESVLRSTSYEIVDKDGNPIDLEIKKERGSRLVYDLYPLDKKEIQVRSCSGRGSWVYDKNKNAIIGKTGVPGKPQYVFRIKKKI
jgi:hypothetical protein